MADLERGQVPQTQTQGGPGRESGNGSNTQSASYIALPNKLAGNGRRRELSVWGLIKVVIAFFTSLFFSTIFLNIVMVAAIAGGIRKQFRSKEPISKVGEHLYGPEKRLKLDLGYYMQLAGYKLEEHLVTTEDGFQIVLHHLIDPDEPVEKRAKRYPVLLQHGLMQSSAAFCTSGRSSLGPYLLECGYDVWLGNNRNGFHPRHTKYTRWNPKVWQWGVREMGTKDMPAMLNFIKNKTGSSKVALASHSQGTTQVFYALSQDVMPQLADHLSSFCALAPAVFAGPTLQRWQYKFIRKLSHTTYHLFFGHHAFFGQMGFFHHILPERVFVLFAYDVMNYMLGWDDALWNHHYKHRQFVFCPSYVSSELMYWWLGPGGFADKGCIFNESVNRWFDESFPPLAIFAPGRDDLVNPYPLISRLSNYETHLQKVQVFDEPTYSHLDVLWATDAVEKVGKPLAKFIWENVPDDQKGRWNAPKLDDTPPDAPENKNTQPLANQASDEPDQFSEKATKDNGSNENAIDNAKENAKENLPPSEKAPIEPGSKPLSNPITSNQN